MVERFAAAAPALRVGLVVAALLLAWRAIHVNAVLYDDSGRPRLGAAVPGTAEASALRRALDDNPAHAAALVMLAREHENAGDAARAARAYRAALALAPYEPEVLQLAGTFFLRHEDPAAIEVLGRLAEGSARPAAFAALASLLASERHAPAVAQLLSTRPEWLDAFLLDACRRGTDPALLARWLRRSSAAASSAQSACAIDGLRAADRWSEAYQVWLNSLPRERLSDVGFVFNGGFEHVPGGAGFDWILQARSERDAGHTAMALPSLGAAGRRALRVSYNGGRQSDVPARQFLALAPGRYELSGRARHEAIKALRGVRWTVRCVERDRPARLLSNSERFVGSSEWRRFAMELEVPAGCPGQVLQLEPDVEAGTPAFVAGTAWFDDLRLARR